MKRRIALILVATLLLTLGLAACGNKQTTTTPTTTKQPEQKVKQLVAQIGPNPETLDPALNSAVDGGNMLLFLFDCLLNVDKNNQLIPGAAETWDVSPDGLTWTFKLREGLKWSDGSPLTAEDFVYSWKRVVDPKTAAPYGETVLGMVEGYEEASKGNVDALQVSAPDARTFVVKLAHPCGYFGQLAAFATLSPVNKATVEANGEAWATKPETYISNGPFKMAEWVPSSHILLVKNENYRDPGSIKLDQIKLLLMEDPNAAYGAYRTGEALLIKDVPTEEIPSLRGNPEFYVQPQLGTYYLSINCSLDQFKDARVRKALSLAIDRDYVANTLMQGVYSPAYNFIPNSLADVNGGFADNANGGKPYISSDYEANLELAKQLLAEAGYPNGEGFPVIEYSTNDSGYHKVVAEYLQQAWSELGLTVKVNIVEWASFTPMRRAGNYQIARNGWVCDYNDASNMLELFVSTNGNNDGKYNNPEYDEVMRKAAAEPDPVKRSQYVHQAEDIIMEDAACIPVAYYNEFWLQSPKIVGSWYSPYGYWYLHYADLAE